jgi:hypothetical protein
MTAIAPNDLSAYIFVANILAVVIVARMGQAVRLPGELGLRFGVRLSDDYYRSMVVWAERTVKGAQGLMDSGAGAVGAFM